MNEMKDEDRQFSPAIPVESASVPRMSVQFSESKRLVSFIAMIRRRRLSWLVIGLCVSIPLSYWLYHAWRSHTIKVLDEQCTTFSKKSQWDELTSIARRWSKLESDRSEPWLFLAEAAEGNKDWSLVADCLGRIPRDDRRAIPALARKAGIEFENLNRPWDGLKTCDELLRIEPRVLLAHKQAIFFCAMTLQRAEMVRRIRTAIRVRRESPDSYVYLAGASWFYGASLYRHNSYWLESDPNDETFQVARAMQIYMSEAKTNLEEAAKYEHIPPAEDLLKRFPHNLELVAYFLNIAMEDGDTTRVDDLLAAVPPSLADKDARIWRARAWKSDLAGDMQSAAESLQHAYAIDPYWWKLHYQLHDVLRRLGRLKESAAFLKVYEVSMPLAKSIMNMNRSTEALDDLRFREKLLALAELVEDEEVIAALRERALPH